MARSLTRVKIKKKKGSVSARAAKKVRYKPAVKPSTKTSKKSKKGPSLRTGKARRAVEAKAKRAKSVRHPARQESPPVEAQLRRTETRSAPAPPPGPPPRLLRQTKTTTAALILMQKGIEYIYRKDFKKARAELKTLLESYPSETEIIARAHTYIRICDREEAGPKKPPVSADQLYALGVLEHNKGNYDEAISCFRRSLEKHPQADYIYYSLAASMAMNGDLNGSLENLKRAIGLNEDSRIYAKNDSDFAALQARKEYVDLVGLTPASAPESQ